MNDPRPRPVRRAGLLAFAMATALIAAGLAAPTPASADTVATGVTLSWAVDGEVQGKPFYGGSNYLSAGVSDGSQSTYAATSGNVAIVQRSASGAESPATWATRAAHVGAGGSAAQLVRLANGTATTDADGGTSVSWSGAFSVNMYGGLVPFTLTDPTLRVAADGSGTLSADLRGYAGEVGSTAPATPVAPVADVVIATFGGASVDLASGFSLTPDFAGVRVAVPAGGTPQDTSAAGWGSWPQGFVDFQQTTGLGSYWYTSGASTDAGKTPSPIGIGAAGAFVTPATPAASSSGDSGAASTATTGAGASGSTGAKRGGTTTTKTGRAAAAKAAGHALVWGVKTSFRSYITGPIADGDITVAGGARRTEAGLFRFRPDGGSYRAKTGHGTLRYTGSVHFTGHDGVLDIRLKNPVVVVRANGTAVLRATINGKRTSFVRLVLSKATTHTAHGRTRLAHVPTHLTAAGNRVFSFEGSSFYAADQRMDDLSFDAPGRTPGRAGKAAALTKTAKSARTTKPTTAGSLVWGVKSSFRTYITGSIARGAVATSGGAGRTSSGLFTFAQRAGGTFTAKKAAGTSRYRGTVHFTGHQGILDITLADPIVTVTSKRSATLSVVVNGGARRTLAILDLSAGRRSARAGAVTYSGATSTITAAGAALFSYRGSTFYPTGTVLDPVTFTIGKKGGAGASSTAAYAVWSAPKSAPATTGIRVAGGMTVDAGSSIVLHASGFTAGETGIHAVVYSKPHVLDDDITADASGDITTTVALPASLAGAHVVTLQGSVDRGADITVGSARTPQGCPVTDASLTWGFKESFRSYISGTIASGAWTEHGAASYDTPHFSWSGGTGVDDPDDETAEVSFTGGIRFTGHDGALDVRITNPELRILDADTAELLVDVRSKKLDGGGWVAQKAVRFVTIDLAKARVTEEDGSVRIADAPTTLTTEGAEGFAGFYEAGVAFDPIDATLPVGASCATGAAAGATGTPTAAPGPAVAASQTQADAGTVAVPTWLLGAGGAALAVLVAALIVLAALQRRRRA